LKGVEEMLTKANIVDVEKRRERIEELMAVPDDPEDPSRPFLWQEYEEKHKVRSCTHTHDHS